MYVFSIMGATLFVTHKFVLLFIQSLENKRFNPKRIEKRGVSRLGLFHLPQED